MADYPVANDDVAQVTVFATYQSSKILNVFHYKAVTAAPVATGNAEVNRLCTQFIDKVIQPAAGVKWIDTVVQGYVFDYVQGQIVAPTRRYYTFEELTAPGGIIDDGCPSNIGATVSYQSATVGRGRSGSKHYTGFPNLDLGNGQVGAGVKDSLNAITANTLLTLTGLDPGLTWEPIIFNFAKPLDRNGIASTYVHPETRVMRRRTLYVGI